MTKTSKTEQSKRLKKVAKQLGVSYASISRSFNTEPTNNSLRDGSLHGITVVPGAREAALQEAASQEAAARACPVITVVPGAHEAASREAASREAAARAPPVITVVPGLGAHEAASQEAAAQEAAAQAPPVITVVPGGHEAALREAVLQEAAARACRGSGSGGGGGGGGGEGGGSPSSLSHAASPSSAALEAGSRGMAQPVTPTAAATLHPGTHYGGAFLRRQGQENIQTMTPTSYQELPLEQQQRHCRGILTAMGNHSSTPLSARSNPTPTSTIPGDSLRSHAAAAPGQPVPCALSFGGFHAPQCRAAPLLGGKTATRSWEQSTRANHWRGPPSTACVCITIAAGCSKAMWRLPYR
jgi:hypothetical protein